MLSSQLRRRASSAASGRNSVETYVTAWYRVCNALWQRELEDPLFRRAVELVEANQTEPGPDTHWLHREAWRGCIRAWWFSVRDCYASPAEIPQDWIVLQREWEPERETLNPAQSRAVCSEQRAATWAQVEALIETGAYWPLDLDAPHLVRAQFETLCEWVPPAAQCMPAATSAAPRPGDRARRAAASPGTGLRAVGS
jgi:hypothetical protein